MDTDFTTLSASTPVTGTPDTNEANKHLITSLGDISATGKHLSDMLVMILTRISTGDTYGADARLLEFDIHYQIDAFGSRGLFSK